MPGPITDPVNCDSVIGEVDSTLCNPVIRAGQVQRVFITLVNNNADFTPYVEPPIGTSVNNPAAWAARMDQSAANAADGGIITLHVIGEKPAPEETEQEIPMGLTRVLSRTHTLPLRVMETSDKINMLMRKWAKHGATVGAWYETSQPTLKGSAIAIHKPIILSIKASNIVPPERTSAEYWQINATWKELGSEDSIESPVPATPEPA